MSEIQSRLLGNKEKEKYRKTDPGTQLEYWVKWHPKVELRHKYSDYYENNDLRHSGKTIPGSRVNVQTLAKKFNAETCVNGSPYNINEGVWGISIRNGKMKSPDLNGWNTVSIDQNGTFFFHDPSVTYQEILNKGHKTAFGIMMPLVNFGELPADGVKYRYKHKVKDKDKVKEYNGWNDVRSARTVIGQNKDGICFITAPGVSYEWGFTYADMARIAKAEGCWSAFALDGGGSTEMWEDSGNRKVDIDNETPRRLCAHVVYVRLNTGWEKEDGEWYYYENGNKAKGWKKVDGKWYYLNEFGSMAIGWKKVNGTWYYLNEDGSMAIGWKQVDGKWYYLDESGAMKTNTVIDGWQIDGSGVATKIN